MLLKWSIPRNGRAFSIVAVNPRPPAALFSGLCGRNRGGSFANAQTATFDLPRRSIPSTLTFRFRQLPRTRRRCAEFTTARSRRPLPGPVIRRPALSRVRCGSRDAL